MTSAAININAQPAPRTYNVPKPTNDQTLLSDDFGNFMTDDSGNTPTSDR